MYAACGASHGQCVRLKFLDLVICGRSYHLVGGLIDPRSYFLPFVSSLGGFFGVLLPETHMRNAATQTHICMSAIAVCSFYTHLLCGATGSDSKLDRSRFPAQVLASGMPPINITVVRILAVARAYSLTYSLTHARTLTYSRTQSQTHCTHSLLTHSQFYEYVGLKSSIKDIKKPIMCALKNSCCLCFCCIILPATRNRNPTLL